MIIAKFINFFKKSIDNNFKKSYNKNRSSKIYIAGVV